MQENQYLVEVTEVDPRLENFDGEADTQLTLPSFHYAVKAANSEARLNPSCFVSVYHPNGELIYEIRPEGADDED